MLWLQMLPSVGPISCWSNPFTHILSHRIPYVGGSSVAFFTLDNKLSTANLSNRCGHKLWSRGAPHLQTPPLGLSSSVTAALLISSQSHNSSVKQKWWKKPLLFWDTTPLLCYEWSMKRMGFNHKFLTRSKRESMGEETRFLWKMER